MLFLCDDQTGQSTYIYAPSWEAAERLTFQYGYTLVGRSVGWQPGGGFKCA